MAAKRIWILQQGEQLPCDPGPPRLLRSAILAAELAKRGHDVRFFNSTFNHQQKRQRAQHSTEIDAGEGYPAVLLRGMSYRKNISVSRIFSQRQVAKEFTRLAPTYPEPDVIVCSYPTIDLAAAGVRFGAANKVPVIVDCRDMWPDIFSDHLGPFARFLARPVLGHFERERNAVMAGASAITGITDAFVDWGVMAAGRRRRTTDRAFHLAISPNQPTDDELAKARKFWQGKLGARKAGSIVLSFAGSINRRSDFATLFMALKSLPAKKRRRIVMVICGKGDGLDDVAKLAAGCAEIVFAGWRNAAEINVLFSQSDVGLLPYPNSKDFLISYPNKVGEYLSHGLTVMSSLEGLTAGLLAESEAGECYRFGDVADARRVLEKLLGDVDGRQKQREACFMAYRKNFDPKLIYADFCRYVEQMAR